MTCMFCGMLDRKKQNKQGEVWCEKWQTFVCLISEPCKYIKPFYETEDNNDRHGEKNT